MKSGTPELIEAMDSGKIPITTASVLATKPAKKQMEFLEKNRNGRGKIRGPKVLEKPMAVLFSERMDKITGQYLGIRDQYGSVEEMMDSALWASSTKAEKKRCVESTVEAADSISEIAKAMVAYAKKSLK